MPFAALFLSLATAFASQGATESSSDQADIRQAVLDYAEG